MSKKIISVMLAVILVMSTFVVSAFAVEFEDETSEYTQTWGLNEPVLNDDGTYTVEVTLTANYVAGAISFKIDAPEAAKLVDAVAGAAITYEANVEFNKSGLVTIIPDASVVDTTGADLEKGGVVATLTYELTGASAKLDLVNDPKTATNPDGTLIATRLSNGNYVNGEMISGQKVIDAEGAVVTADVIASVTLGEAAAAPELVAFDGTCGVVDNAAGWVYGIDAVNGESAEDVFDVTNGGYFETTNGTATGSVLTVYTADGEAVAEYTMIVFGDVNADGGIDSEDAGYICDYEALALDSFDIFGISDDLAMIAGDVTGDGACDSEDAGYICDYEALAIDDLMDLAAVCEVVYSYNN